MSNEEKNIITVNRDPISSKEIRGKENLEGILNQHRSITKRPAYKRKKVYFFLLLLFLLLLLVYYADKEGGIKKETETEQISD